MAFHNHPHVVEAVGGEIFLPNPEKERSHVGELQIGMFVVCGHLQKQKPVFRFAWKHRLGDLGTIFRHGFMLNRVRIAEHEMIG